MKKLIVVTIAAFLFDSVIGWATTMENLKSTNLLEINKAGISVMSELFPVPTVVATDEKVSATVNSDFADATLDSGISRFKGYQALIAERERSEQAIKAIKAKFGKDDRQFHEAEDLYIKPKCKMAAWVVVTQIRLAGRASIYTGSECKYLLTIVRENETFVSYVAKLTGFHPQESLFKNIRSVTLKKWLKEIQNAYNRADSVGKDKIFEDIDALRWKFFWNIKPEFSSQGYPVE